MKSFIIHEPYKELTEGYFTPIIKYSVIFLIAWMMGQLIIFTYPCLAWYGDKYPPLLKWLNDYNVLNWFLVLVCSLVYLKFLIKKSNSLYITNILFDSKNNLLNLELLNNFSGKTKEISINYSVLNIRLETIKNNWYGSQNIYKFYNKDLLIASLNIEKTAWKYFPEIEYLKATLNQKLPCNSENTNITKEKITM
jgi:hypothetical protein